MPSTSTVPVVTVADLLAHLGDVPAARVRVHPEPGTANEADVLAVYDREKRLCELVDGVLVEKTVGYYESYLAAMLIRLLGNFMVQHDLGLVAGADGMLRLAPGLVRIPDVSLVAWARLPGRRVPRQPIPEVIPDLLVEVLSEGNTSREMSRKLDEYFASGVRLAWLVDPVQERVTVYTARQRASWIPRPPWMAGRSCPVSSCRLAAFFRPLSPERRPHTSLDGRAQAPAIARDTGQQGSASRALLTPYGLTHALTDP